MCVIFALDYGTYTEYADLFFNNYIAVYVMKELGSAAACASTSALQWRYSFEPFSTMPAMAAVASALTLAAHDRGVLWDAYTGGSGSGDRRLTLTEC